MSIVTVGPAEPHAVQASAPAADSRAIKAVALRWTARQLGASSVTLLASVPSRIIQGAVLGPAGYGLVVLAGLVSTYAGYADLGMRYVLTRQLPLATGPDAPRAIEEMKAVVYSWMSLVSIVAVAALWVMFAAGISLSGLLTVPRLVLISTLVVTERANAYLHNLTKALGEFDWVAQGTSRIAILTPFVTVAGVVLLQVTGFLAAQVALQAYQFLFYWSRLRRNGRVFPPMRLPRAALKQCLGIGVVLWAINLSQSIYWAMETTLLAVFAGSTGVGQYAFALTLLNPAINLGGPFNNVAARQMLMERAGAADGDTVFLQKYLQRPLVIYLLMISVVLGAAFFAYAAVVRLFLVDFLASISVSKVVIFGHMLFATTYFTGAMLNVDALFGRRLVFLWSCLTLNAVVDIVLLSTGYGLVAVAWASTLSYGIYSALLLAFSSRLAFGSYRPGVELWLRLALLSGLLAGALQALDRWPAGAVASAANPVAVATVALFAALKFVIYGLTAVGLYAAMFRSYRLLDELRDSSKYLFNMLTGRLEPAVRRG